MLPFVPNSISPLSAVIALLGIAFVVKGLVPRWRAKWGWGRAGKAPISLPGHCGIGISFLLLAFGSSTKPAGWDPAFDTLLMLLGFAIFIAAGLYDTTRNRKP
jgi:hypothetical protein